MEEPTDWNVARNQEVPSRSAAKSEEAPKWGPLHIATFARSLSG